MKLSILVLLITVGILSIGAQKTRKPVLDVGTRVYYTPDMDEGHSRLVHHYAAVISGMAMAFNEDTRRDEVVTDEDGHILVHLHVFRPEHLGGSFDKDNVPVSEEGKAGTCRGVE